MSRLGKAFLLTSAIMGAITCVVWLAVGIALVLYGHTDWHAADAVVFFIPALLVGAGAFVVFGDYRNERKNNAPQDNVSDDTRGNARGASGFVLITTRPRALSALVLAVWLLIQSARSLALTRPYSLIVQYEDWLPHWAVVLANLGFYGTFVWFMIEIGLAPLKKEEKALFTLLAAPLLSPIGVLLPKATSILRFVEGLLGLVAALASISILLSLSKNRENAPEENV